MTFYETQYTDEWYIADSMKEILDTGTYMLPKYYNINDTSLTEEQKNTILTHDFIIILDKYLKLYNEYEKLYGRIKIEKTTEKR